MKHDNMNTYEHDQMNETIVKYLSGKASEEEILQLGNWVKASGQNREYYLQLKNIWDASGNQFNINDSVTKKALNKVLKQIDNRRPGFWFYWQKVAAVLFVPVLLGSLLWGKFSNHESEFLGTGQVVYNEVFAAYGTRSAIKLADGSKVWLNSGSTLSYPENFAGKKRVVKLKGEGYFEVQSDVSRPFIVQTQTLSVTATGTKFNVQAYQETAKTQVTLVSGKVSVKKGDNNIIANLKPNQHLVFDSVSGKNDIQNEDVYKYIAWKDGKLIFRNRPLSEVVEKIGQLYNVEIELKGEELQGYLYRATFQEESLSEILKLLKLSSPIDYREVKRTPLPDGSFPKKKIIIFSTKEKKGV